MSRMDRFKDVHKELNKPAKGSLFARKELKEQGSSSQEPETNFQEDPRYQESFQAEPQTFGTGYHDQEQPAASSSKGAAPKKPKKRRRKPKILRIILALLILLVAYSGVAFAMGKRAADKDASIPQQELQTFNGVKDGDGASNILLLGSDSREGEQARADTIMVLQLNGPSKKPKLISFMRDTYVNIPGYASTKINATYAYGGAELVRQTLKENFQIDCKYYAIVDFMSFEKVIDTLFPKGLKVDAEKDMSAYIDESISKGPQVMNSHTLLNYARFRMDEEGDFGRVRRQQQVMNTIFSAMKSPLAIARLPYAAGKVMGYTSTDLPMSFLLMNSFNLAKGASGVQRMSVPVEGSWEYGYDDNGGSVLFCDNDTNAQAVKDFLAKK